MSSLASQAREEMEALPPSVGVAPAPVTLALVGEAQEEAAARSAPEEGEVVRSAWAAELEEVAARSAPEEGEVVRSAWAAEREEVAACSAPEEGAAVAARPALEAAVAAHHRSTAP